MSRGMRTQMKKTFPRLNRRLSKEIQGVEATWWEQSSGSRHLRQSRGPDRWERMGCPSSAKPVASLCVPRSPRIPQER